MSWTIVSNAVAEYGAKLDERVATASTLESSDKTVTGGFEKRGRGSWRTSPWAVKASRSGGSKAAVLPARNSWGWPMGTLDAPHIWTRVVGELPLPGSSHRHLHSLQSSAFVVVLVAGDTLSFNFSHGGYEHP